MKQTKVLDTPNKLVFNEYFYMRQFIPDPTAPGIEIGAAAHNPYWSALVNCLNVAPDDENDFALYQNEQVRLCGEYVEVDIPAEGDDLPLPDESQAYIVSSHSFEHFPNPIKTLLEWDRVLQDGGVVVLVVPLRNALPSDADRPISTVEQLVDAYERGVTVDTFEPTEWDKTPVSRRGHYYVYEPDLVKRITERYTPHWKRVGGEAQDSKVGNGFSLIFKKEKSNDPVPVLDVVEKPKTTRKVKKQ
jgi:SAM-dependent methyltransferase